MKSYSKADVEMHSDGFGRGRRPAINVKCHNFPSVDKIAAHYGKDEDDADVSQAVDWLFELEQESFWQFARLQATEVFGRVKIYNEGRSGGWLVVDGLKDFDDWDAIDLAKWRKFERWIKGAIPTDNADWLSSMIDTIDANEWLLTSENQDEKERESFLATVQSV